MADHQPIASNWIVRGTVLGALVGVVVVAIPILDLSRTNYKFEWSAGLLLFTVMCSMPAMIVGLVVGFIGGAFIESFCKKRSRSQQSDFSQ